ncbi:Hsp20/alpha crystallin family protein, partial [Patescibacteria group bacterium]|nr:Hsp20/alpha crystallin family protein [Patescibacteria group bacterium]
NVVAEVELPGANPKNREVEVKDNILKVEARAEEKKEEKGKGYYRKELSRGFYKRAVPLPVEVIGEKAGASFEGGILKVVIPKRKPVKKEKEKKIKIKVKGTKTA